VRKVVFRIGGLAVNATKVAAVRHRDAQVANFAPELIAQHGSAKPGCEPAALSASRENSYSLAVFPFAPNKNTGSCLEPAAFSFPNTGGGAISHVTLSAHRPWDFEVPLARRARRTLFILTYSMHCNKAGYG
jgi:hypothetical protein